MSSSHRNEMFTYNPDNMDYAISMAKKLDNASLSEGVLTAKNACPQSFVSSTFKSVIADVEKLSDETLGIEKVLSGIKKSIEDNPEESGVDIAELNHGTYTYVKDLESGQKGFLYIPAGYESTKGLPLIVDLGGRYEMTNPYRDDKYKSGFPNLIKEGKQDFEAVIWIPMATQDDVWTNESNKDNKYTQSASSLSRDGKAYATIVTCEELIDKYNLDSNRVSIIGYSAGAYGVFKYLENYPNYFSTAVTWGGYVLDNQNEVKNKKTLEENRELVAQSGTSITMFAGTNDTGSIRQSTADYESIKDKGGQVALYCITGADHGQGSAILNKALVNDMISIEKGQKLNMPNEVQNVSLDDAKLTSLHYTEYKDSTNNWYKPLISNEKFTQITPEQLDFVPPRGSLHV